MKQKELHRSKILQPQPQAEESGSSTALAKEVEALKSKIDILITQVQGLRSDVKGNKNNNIRDNQSCTGS
jgi:hypothetical protein